MSRRSSSTAAGSPPSPRATPGSARPPQKPMNGATRCPHRGRELPHASLARVLQRVPVPALRVRRIGAGLGRVVPVVGAAEHGDGRRAALGEQLRVERGIVALDRLERLARVVARRRVQRLPARAERAIEPVVAAERRQEARQAPLQELRPVGIVHHLRARRGVRLGRGVRVHAQQPRGREDGARRRRGTPRARGRRARPWRPAARSRPSRPPSRGEAPAPSSAPAA